MPRGFVALPGAPAGAAGRIHIRCPVCGESSTDSTLRRRAMVCPWCDHHLPLEAGRHAELLLDEGSFQPLEGAPAGPSLFGRGAIAGRPLLLAVSDPMDGDPPYDPQPLIALAETAHRERRPLLWVVSALRGVDPSCWPALQAALQALDQGGPPWLALLCGPCHGPLAALALQADIVLAEPGTVLDPIHPADRRAAGGLPPERARRPRDLLRAGWADAVLPREEQRAGLALLLDLLSAAGPGPARFRGVRAPRLSAPPAPLGALCEPFFELHGDRTSGDDPALVGGLGRLRQDGSTALVLAATHRPGQAIGVAGWRKAARLVRLAGRLELPLVVLVDRPRLRAGRRDPAGALAAALGKTLRAFLAVPVPTIAVWLGGEQDLAGQALSAADCLLCAEAASAGLRRGGAGPDGTFAREQDLPGLIARHLQEMAQTYVLHGPLGRRKLLQRRYVRWTRSVLAGGDLPAADSRPGEQG